MTEECNNKIENEEKIETKTEEPEVKWAPVAHLDPYEHAPKEVRLYHMNYVKMWLKDEKGK